MNVSPNADQSNQNYRMHVAKSLSTLKKVVILLIDEIYITSRLYYRAKCITGSAAVCGIGKNGFNVYDITIWKRKRGCRVITCT